MTTLCAVCSLHCVHLGTFLENKNVIFTKSNRMQNVKAQSLKTDLNENKTISACGNDETVSTHKN